MRYPYLEMLDAIRVGWSVQLYGVFGFSYKGDIQKELQVLCLLLLETETYRHEINIV